MNQLKRNRLTDHFYVFMIGFLICLFVQFYLQDKFERNFFENVTQGLANKRPLFNEDSSIVDALHVTYRLLSNRSVVLKETSHSNYDLYSGSLTNDLLTAKDACGSYAAVLTNLLKTMGYDTRIVQMKVNNIYGGHIITEVSTKKGWVVLDAMYDLFFKTPAGTMASFADVSGNWAYYKGQTPKDYNKDYKYDDLRYANWDKIPIVMPIMKSILILTLGEKKTNTISIRPLFLRKYKFYYLLLFPLILFFSVRFLSNKIHIRHFGRQARSLLSARILSGLGLNRYLNYQHSHSRSKQMYYKSFISEVGLQPLLDCQNSNGLNAQKTPVSITVFNIPFNSKISALRHRLRLPRYIIKSHNEDDEKVREIKTYVNGDEKQ